MARCLLALAGAAASLLLAGSPGAADRVLLERESAYNAILVTEDEQGLRAMYFGGGRARQSVVKPGDPDHLEARYVQAFPVALAFMQQPRRMLAIGLGGGVVPMFMHRHRPGLHIDVVELDPEVIAVARSHFGFRDGGTLRAFAGDGRRFIERTKVRYDIVFLDAYGSESVPHALTTQEFLAGVRRTLTPRGVVIGNIWGRNDNPAYDSMVQTYRSVFGEVWILDLENALNKLVIARAKGDGVTREELVRRARELTGAMRLRNDLGGIVERGLRPPGADGEGSRVLTDAR